MKKIIPLIRSNLLFRYPFVKMAMSTRIGGISSDPYGMNTSYSVGDVKECVNRNRELFFREVGIDVERLAIPRQIHSTEVKRIDSPGVYPDTDGLITNQENLCLTVTVADCVPIFLYDKRNHCIGLIHAGWRGTSKEIVVNSIRKLISEFGSRPDQIEVFIGPAAGVCCYEVGQDVSRLFSGNVIRTERMKTYLNVKEANKIQLISTGVSENNIEMHPDCTICQNEVFHSYRRDGKLSGRMMGVLGIMERQE